MSQLKAIVLAAGKGVRMKSDRPKVLFEANGLPLLYYPLGAARAAGADRLLVIVGAGRETVEEKFRAPDVTFVVQDKQLGTGHAVKCARAALEGYDGYVFVLCGDAPLIRPETLRRLHETTIGQGAVCSVLTCEFENPTGYGRIIRAASGVERIIEEKDADDAQRAVREVNSGTYCFRWPDLDAVLDRITPVNKQGEYYLTDAVEILISDGKRVEAVLSDTPEEALGVNSRAQLAEVSRALRMRVIAHLMVNGVTVIDPATAYIDCRAQIGPETVIKPFVVIDGAVTIGANCTIGPFTHIRGESQIGDEVALGSFVEVTRSKVGRKARAKHLAFVGDARVGEDANIAAGVITANTDGKKFYVTEIGDGAYVGAGTIIVAPGKVASGGSTGAGAVVTAKSTVPAGETWVGVPARKLK
jgi:bifunctional UDP-N-acetylglucosamine pyrophosphorylase/glucosamine-1-phosphate N-acetyltransferase